MLVLSFDPFPEPRFSGLYISPMLRPRLLSRAELRRWLHGALVVAIVAVVACGEDNITGPAVAGSTGRRLTVGEATVCALDLAGKVYCWGNNSTWWEYGADSATLPRSASPVAVPVPALSRLGGGMGPHMCGLTLANTAVCWGRGGSGELGGGTLPDSSSGNAAIVVLGGVVWADISVSRLSTCGLLQSGAGYCWGSNQRGEIGDTLVAINARTASPFAVDGGKVFTSIVPGWLHACGIATSGAAYCWGDNSSGQLGIGFADLDIHRGPLLASFTERFLELSVGSRSTCGITTDHRALCWGLNSTGQLGDGTTISRHLPTEVAGGLKFVHIATGSGFGGGTNVFVPGGGGQASAAHTCALTETGVPYCWGWNGAGQVGDGTTADRLSPVAVQGNLRLSAIALGGSATCGMRGNAVWCWGSNFVGQLGNGTLVNSSVPVAVVGPFSKP